MVVIGQSGCIPKKVVVFGQKLLYSEKSSFILVKVVAFRQCGCIREKVVVVRQKRIYSAKIGSNWVKVVVFGQCGFFRAKWLYSGKVVVFGLK